MSNENDDEYVLLEDDCSAKFLSKFPWILTWGYDFDKSEKSQLKLSAKHLVIPFFGKSTIVQVI